MRQIVNPDSQLKRRRMIHVGIIGFGFMGQMHWQCYGKLRNQARVVAVADRDGAKGRGNISGAWANLGDGAKAVDFSSVTITTDWRELLSMSDVDAVDVCLPTPFHTEVVEAALSAGKYVLCEKPLATSVREAQKIATAAAKAKTFLMPSMCMRFWPEWVWLKKAISDNRYGDVLSASFLRQGTLPPGGYRNEEVSGNALLDLHIHDTDFICHLFGKPKAVSSREYRARTGQIDYVSTLYVCDSIPLVVAEGGWSFGEPYSFDMRYTVSFERQVTADFDLSRSQPLIVYERWQPIPIVCEAIDGWLGQIRYFVECVSTRQMPTVVTVKDAIQSLQVIEAERRSIVDNTFVTV